MSKNNNNTMILVTGAAGFLGGTICRQLVERGDKVRAFVLPNGSVLVQHNSNSFGWNKRV